MYLIYGKIGRTTTRSITSNKRVCLNGVWVYIPSTPLTTIIPCPTSGFVVYLSCLFHHWIMEKI